MTVLTAYSIAEGWESVLWKPPQNPFVCELIRKMVDGYMVHAILYSLTGLKLDEWWAE